MKTTDRFKEVIQEHLNERAKKDSLFAETLKKPNKNIDDCITYILNEVKKSGCAGFADEEIFGMAVHFYDEDDLKPGKEVSGRIVVNHSVDLTEEEKAAARQKALDEIILEEKERLKKKPSKKSDTPGNQPLSLF